MKMKMKMHVILSFLILLSISMASYATVTVKMYSLEEAMTDSTNEINISRPRIYIKNTGTQAISNISYNYYFKTENNLKPFVENYWTGGADVFLVSDGNSKYHISYVVSGTLQPGQMIPQNSGNVVGLHYNNWEPWDKTNDYSNNKSTTYLENQKIVVYANGVKIYGTSPDTTGGDPEPPEALQFNSFALYATDSAKVKDSSVFTGGGAIGSNVDVNVGTGSTVWGNIISGNNVSLRSGSKVYGDIYVKGKINIYNNASITGVLHEHSQVATLTIPVRTVTVGTTDKTILKNTTITLSPGSYRNVYVDSLGTLILLPGSYKFSQFLLRANAKVQLNAAINQTVSIDVDKELEFQDRSEVKFQAAHSYAPALQIYTNDTSAIRVGVSSKVIGIINAPKARVSLYSKAQCDGAIYAKKITVEPGVNFLSSDVNPEGDQDHDGIPNYVEIQIGTVPTDSNSFKMIAIPHPAVIDNSTDQEVTYDLSKFYLEYQNSPTMKMSLPAGSLAAGKVNALLKVSNKAVNFDGDTLTGFNLPQGYRAVSRFFSFKQNSFAAGKNITVTIPVPERVLGVDNYSVMYHTAGAASWTIASAPVALVNGDISEISAMVQSPDAIVVVVKKPTATAYLDDGMVFSNEYSDAVLGADMEILDVPQNATASYTINYTVYDAANNLTTTNYPGTFSVVEENGAYKLRSNHYDFTTTSSGKMVINNIQVTSSTGVDYNNNVNYTINPGQKMTLKASCTKALYNNDASAIAALYDINYKLESIDLDGEGRIKQALFKGGVGATTYDFYLKDHLGSTREVVDEDGNVTEATMYYPYGTMVPLKPPAPGNNAREKFTGKELDSVYLPASEIAFNLQINNFDAGMHYYGELYVSLVDLASNQSFLKVYEMTYDKNSKKFTLNTSERFPDNMKVTHLRINTSGATNTINYEKDFTATVNTENGLTISLTANGSDLINSSTGYFTSATFVPAKVAGSKLYYFGARYYDPEVGVWGCTDPKSQYYNPYGYSTNPVSFIDPDGQFAVGYIIGALVGAYVGGAMSNISADGSGGAFNPGNWDWSAPGTWSGIAGGAMVGGSLGSGIEDNIIASRMANNTIGSSYGHVGARSLIKSGFYDSYLTSIGVEGGESQLAQAGGRRPLVEERFMETRDAEVFGRRVDWVSREQYEEMQRYNPSNALSREQKDIFRTDARDIWQTQTGRRAIWDELDIHHRIPLEYSHLYPSANPNRISNLEGVTGVTHRQINSQWTTFRNTYRDATAAQVMRKAIQIDYQFGSQMKFIR